MKNLTERGNSSVNKSTTNNFVVENNSVNKECFSMKDEIEQFRRCASGITRISTVYGGSLLGENISQRVREVKDLRK